MRLTFTLHDVQEISFNTYRGFISTFNYVSEESKSDSSDESDLYDFDPDLFGCGEITPEIEKMVENTWEIYDPLTEVYDITTLALIKETVTSSTEETQCAGLHFFKDMAPGEDRDLITTCTVLAHWCCCKTVKKVSPIIAEETSNLFFY